MDWESFYRNYRQPGYLEGYEIVNKLGAGVFGEVYKIRKISIGKYYAAKFLRVEDAELKSAVLRELESVKLLAQIDHPNLVSIEDQGEVDGIPYIIMSYAGEETLKSLLRQGPLGSARAVDIFRQVCAGVQALHDRSIIHFDLKPANIYLKGELARVGDYGLSKLISRSRRSLSFGRGTPYYMAPEMLQRRGDQRSDIYSLGVILFECLTGDVPFKGDTEWEVLRKHESEPLVVPDTIGEPCRAAIRRAMAKAPEDRFESVAELRQAVTRRAAPRVARPRRTPPPRPAGREIPAPAAPSPRALLSLACFPFGLVLSAARSTALLGWSAVVGLVRIPVLLVRLGIHLTVFLVLVAIFFIIVHLLFKLPQILWQLL